MTAPVAAVRKNAVRLLTLGIVVVLVVGVILWRSGAATGYKVTIVFPEATDLQRGSLVEVQGLQVGKVSKLGVSDGQAMVTVTLESASAPLHTGSMAKIDYKALLGERYVEIVPAPASNPAIPNGGVLTGGENRVELAQVLSSFDAPTRQRLAEGIPQLTTVFGSPTNVNQTIQAAAPTVEAVAQIIDAVGQNGLALRQLVTSMADLSTRLVNRQGSIVQTISGLTAANTAVAAQDANLTVGLQNLPPTLTQISTTLSHIPATTANVVPLLNDLAPGAATLPSFAAKLRPTIDQLSPVISQLQPNLAALNTLLTYTPNLSTTANAVLPGLTQVTSTLVAPQKLTVPVNADGSSTTQVTSSIFDWFRPYTPEFAAFMTNWGSWLSGYTSTGHIGPFTGILGNGALTGETPTSNGFTSPATGAAIAPTDAQAPPFPGTVAGQACQTCYQATDAAGNPIQ